MKPLTSLQLPVLLWLLAFVCALYPINDRQLEFFAGAIVLLFAWTLTILSRDLRNGWNLPRSPVIVLGGLFWLLVVLSAFWSEIKPASLTALCFFSVLPLTFFTGVMAGEEGYFKKIFYALGIIFAVLSVWAVFQFFFLNAYFLGQARHPLADPSSLGALFSLALFCAMAWVLADRPAREHKRAVALAILLVCGIIATVARGPIFAFVPGFVFFAALLWPRVKAQRKSLLLIMMSGIAFYGLTHIGVQKKYDLGLRLMGTASIENIQNNRLAVWSSAVEIIKERPLLGTGIGTFFLYYPEHRKASEADGVFLVHNDPLQFWVELGVFGPLLFYGFVIAASVRTFAAMKKMRGDGRVIVAGIFSGLVAMVTHAHVSFNHYNLSILMMTGLMLSVWFLLTGRALAETPRIIAMPQAVPLSLNRFLLVLPFLMTGWLFLSIVGGEHMANRARDALFKQDMDHFADDINRANRISQGLNYRAYLFAVNVPMSILDYRKNSLNEEQQKKLYEQIADYMKNVLAVNPRAGGAYYYLGKVQGMVAASVIPKGTPDPEFYYQEALRLDPMHLGARMALYRLYKAEGKSRDVLLSFMEPGAMFTYSTPLAMEYLGEMAKIYLEAGNYGKMNETLARMAEYKKRSDYSAAKQKTSIPQAIMGGDAQLMVP